MPPVNTNVATAMMMYMSAQNELSARADENIDDIKANEPLDNLQIYIINDTIISGPARAATKRVTREIDLPPGAFAANSKNKPLLGNERVTNADVFQAFLGRAENDFQPLKTRQKILVLWGHGRGLVLLDELQEDGTTRKVATIPEFTDALEKRAMSKTDPLRFNIIAFDSCYMGVIEAMNQFQKIADFALVSCTAIDAAGYPYRPIIAKLKELGPGLVPATAADLVKKEYDEHYKQLGPSRKRYLFVCNMKKIGACVDALNALGDKLSSWFGLDLENDPVRKALRLANEAASGELPEYPAVLSFINKLRTRLKDIADLAQFEPLLANLKDSVDAAFSGNLGDTGTIPTSPLIWCPTQINTFNRYRDLYNELDANNGVNSGWASMWDLYHHGQRLVIPAAVKKNKFEFCCSV
jgi:hypothetical protein